MPSAEDYVTRWQAAGLLDERTATSIRTFEETQAKPRGRQWQVLLALILGAILLGAGVLLFVAAHWDEVSPATRLCMVLAMLIFFHGLGLLVRERFAGLATAMHAVGTISAGAAIALVGQIFNMNEHWPAAVLLWALCAAAGWLLLRDHFQQTLTLLLVPAWIVAEWADRTSAYTGADVYLARMGLVIGAVYLSAFLHSRRRAMAGILFAVGAVLMPVSIGILASGWMPGYQPLDFGFVTLTARMMSFGIVAAAIAAGIAWDRRSAFPASVAAGLGMALPWAQTTIAEQGFKGHPWTRSEPSVLAYALVAAAAVFLVAWGVRSSAKALVNYGVVAFAMTVMWFYFSSVMDKLGRSVGLIVLGVVFLAGGWALEQTRRRLLSGMAGGAA
ncbi:putative membrane protein [Granulicella aggregans]|uniref:Putative membrane protein n=1 Tax=Granulicella aggregans TaxID=474949 RepID=A0A7W7ZBQ5_9BACT|nr:DUF2157 domain-containing protein [Granulicella aggregans]MBB5056903.1 putative membrane protein [Granulicella aggregans]